MNQWNKENGKSYRVKFLPNFCPPPCNRKIPWNNLKCIITVKCSVYWLSITISFDTCILMLWGPWVYKLPLLIYGSLLQCLILKTVYLEDMRQSLLLLLNMSSSLFSASFSTHLQPQYLNVHQLFLFLQSLDYLDNQNDRNS